LSADGRPPLAELLAAADDLRTAGWRVVDIATQPGPSGKALPIRAWLNGDEVDGVLIGGIHGREPAGVVALARYVRRIVEHGRTRRLLVMPILNPWGYLHDVRYGPSGQSVSDSDHLLGRAAAPACAEADAITRFLMNDIRVRPGAGVLDLHEDPVYEAPDYHFDGQGSYFYVIGDLAADHPAARRVRDCLERAALPLVRDGVTRFGERLVDGAVVDSADGSIDELLARRLGCTPVITVEPLVRAPAEPPLAARVEVHLSVLDAFFGSPP
jgi:predicted deacylase